MFHGEPAADGDEEFVYNSDSSEDEQDSEDGRCIMPYLKTVNAKCMAAASVNFAFDKINVCVQ